MSAVNAMPWNHKLFDIAWRLAIVLLPWQTRWFHEGPLLGGYPWEGGRWSVYLSWLPMIVMIVLGYRRGGRRPPVPGRRFFIACLALIPILSIFLSTYRPATTQWWIEVLLLGGFAWTLIRHVDRHDLARWIIYAIIPHALLGLVQYLSQSVVGSKWLGIATQNPATPGVSVIDVFGTRWLRAYGGFPHPNIFGGWLMLGLGILVGVDGVHPRAHGVRPYIESVSLILFSVALVLSFSRSAWLAVFVLLITAICHAFRAQNPQTRSHVFTATCLVLCSAGVTAALSAPLIQTRTTTTTLLETRSLTEREQGWQSGIELFKRHPWIGIGPRTIRRALPIPPHNVFLLALSEIGLLGVLFSTITLFILYKKLLPPYSILHTRYSILLIFLPILLLDHYLWSTWSGLALASLLMSHLISPPDKGDEGGLGLA